MEFPRVVPRALNCREVMLVEWVVLTRLHWTLHRLGTGSAYERGHGEPRYRDELQCERSALTQAFSWMLPTSERMRGMPKKTLVEEKYLADLLDYCDGRARGADEALKVTPKEQWGRVIQYEADRAVFGDLPCEFSRALAQNGIAGISKTMNFENDEELRAFWRALMREVARWQEFERQLRTGVVNQRLLEENLNLAAERARDVRRLEFSDNADL